MYYTEKRGVYKNPKDLKILNLIKNLILKLPILKIFLKKEKTDFMIVSNTRYKIQKALDIINIKSKNKIAIIQDFKSNSYLKYNNKNYFIVKKFLFFLENNNLIKSDENGDFLVLKKKIELFERIIKFYKPKKIYVVEGDSVTDALIAQICKKKNIKCFCIQHGISPVLFYPKNSKFFLKNFLYDFIYLVDSKMTGEFFKSKNIVKKYELLKNKSRSYNLDNKSKVLFGVPTISKKESLTENVIYYFADMILYFLKKFPNIKIIIRLHPDGLSNKIIFNKIPKNKNIEFHFPHKKSLKESFSDSKISCFIIGTSLIFDSINYSCFPLILKYAKNKAFNFNGLKKYKIAHVSDTFSDFKKEISSLITHKNKLRLKQNNIQIFLKHFLAK